MANSSDKLRSNKCLICYKFLEKYIMFIIFVLYCIVILGLFKCFNFNWASKHLTSDDFTCPKGKSRINTVQCQISDPDINIVHVHVCQSKLKYIASSLNKLENQYIHTYMYITCVRPDMCTRALHILRCTAKKKKNSAHTEGSLYEHAQ